MPLSANEASSQRLNSTPYKACNVLSEVCVCEAGWNKIQQPKAQGQGRDSVHVVNYLSSCKMAVGLFPLQI